MIEIQPDYTNRLSTKGFAKHLREFMRVNFISVTDLEKLCNEKLLSRSSCHRIKNAQINDEYYLKVLPLLETHLENWMISKNWTPFQINENLNTLFPYRKDKLMIINRCQLTSRAVKFFGLEGDPFDVDRVPTEDEMFTDDNLDEIAARIKDTILYKKFTCVIGAVGTGKTSMKIRVHRELEKLANKPQPINVRLIYPEFFDMNIVNVGAIASSILTEFDIKPPREATLRLSRIKELLTSLEKDDVRVCLVFDECHRLNNKVITSLKNFWELTNGGYSRLLGILLFGQPRFVDATLRDYQFREIAERVQVLSMPSIEETARQYLAKKLESVGGNIDELFDPRAVARICAVAKTPLALGNLANAALLDAYKIEEKCVAPQSLNLPDAPRIRNFRAA